MEMYDIRESTLASLIKPKSENTFAVLITFNGSNLPYNIYIPGERHDCRIYTLTNRPMMCTKCQKYGHTFHKHPRRAISYPSL